MTLLPFGSPSGIKKVRKNSVGSDFKRSRLNLIEGSNITLTVADDSANNEIDVTIAAAAGTPGGSDTQVQFNDSGSFGGDAGFTYNKTTDIATLTGGLNISALTTGSVLFAGSSGAISQDNANFFWDDTNNRLGIGTTSPGAQLEVDAGAATTKGLIVKAAASQSANLQEWQNSASTVISKVDSSGNIIIGGGTSAGELRLLEPSASGSNYTAFKAQTQAGDVTYILPAADGTNGQVLTTNGASTLSWTTVSGGGSHALLSATHSDATAGTVVRGDLITGQGVSPTWTRLALGVANRVLRSDGTDSSWAQVALSTDVTGVLSIANGGTNSSTALNNGRVMISSAGAIVERAALTASALTVGDATNGLASLALGTANQLVGMNSGATANEYKTLNGTTNQITVTHAANSVTFATPQNIHTAATPQFGGLGIDAAASSTTFLLHGATTTSKSSQRMPAGTAPTTPVEGDMWNDSTQKTVIHYVDGMKQPLVGTLFTQTADATVTNTTTETTLLSANLGTKTLPANALVAGKTIRVKAWGYLSQDPLDMGGTTLNWKIKLGSTVILATGTYAFGTSPLTDELWELEGLITCRTTGASGTVHAQGRVIGELAPGGLGSSFDFILMKNTSTVTVDTTASQAIDITATWDIALTSATVTCTNVSIEVLN